MRNNRLFRASEEMASIDATWGPLRDVDQFNLSGELIKVETYTGPRLVAITHYAGGLLNNGPHDEPAVQVFNQSGSPYGIVRAVAGRTCNGPNGEPGVQIFDPQGNIDSTSHYGPVRRLKGVTNPKWC